MTREEMVFVLETVTRFSKEYLESLNIEELTKLYRERVENR